MQSKYFGVTFDSRTGKFVAQIRIGTTRYLGRFDDERAAAYAVDNAKAYLQEFFPKRLNLARLNLPYEEQMGPTSTTEALRQKLIDEEAPRYTFSAEGGESAAQKVFITVRELKEVLAKVQNLLRQLEHGTL